MIEFQTNPRPQDLRWFGLIFLLFFTLVSGIVFWRTQSTPIASTIWGIAAAVCLVYYAAPPLRQPIYIGWMAIVFPIGWVLSHVILGAIYFLVVTPIGVLRRSVRDPMRRQFEPDAASYWRPYNPHRESKQYFRQF